MRKYLDTDFEEVKAWREAADFDKNYFSHLGYIVPGIGVGFLYMNESVVGFLDFFITNPKYNQKVRIDALSIIAECLIEEAKIYGIKLLNAQTNYVSMQERMETTLGFTRSAERSSFYKEI